MSDLLDPDHWVNGGDCESAHPVELPPTEQALVQELARVTEERDEARAEVQRLKKEQAQKGLIPNFAYATGVLPVRPEPSRLEIAARLMAANLSRETNNWHKTEAILAVEQADALIAAAKEAK
jgi:hypothetical protein